jgi:hypothetical protein
MNPIERELSKAEKHHSHIALHVEEASALLDYIRALERVYDAAEMQLSVYDSPQLKQELELVRTLRAKASTK